MADFGDEMGDAIWRSLKTPFDEWFRCQIRRLVSGDSNLEPNFNKNGEAESYTLTFDAVDGNGGTTRERFQLRQGVTIFATECEYGIGLPGC